MIVVFLSSLALLGTLILILYLTFVWQGGGGKWSLTFIRALAPPILIFVTSDLNDNFSWTPFYMIQPKTKFRFSVQNHDFWQALEGSDHFMPPPYQRAQYDIPTKERLRIMFWILKCRVQLLRERELERIWAKTTELIMLIIDGSTIFKGK